MSQKRIRIETEERLYNSFFIYGISATAIETNMFHQAYYAVSLSCGCCLFCRSMDKDIAAVVEMAEESLFLRSQLKPTPDLLLCCQQILSKLSKCNIIQIACSTKQGSDEWKRERQLRITGMCSF